jgi:hypothetical protein
MNYEQLVKRVKSNRLPTRKMGELYISEVPEGVTEDHALEIISMTQVAWKYREANAEDIPDDLTDEILDKIEENKKILDGATFDPSDIL